MFILITKIFVLLILCQLIAAAKKKTEVGNKTENTIHHVVVKVDGGASETTPKSYSVKFGHFVESRLLWMPARDKISTPMHYTVNENGCAQFAIENTSTNWRLGLFTSGNTGANEELFISTFLKLEKPVIYYLLEKEKSKWKLKETTTLPIECMAIAKSLKYKGNVKLMVEIKDYPKLQESALGATTDIKTNGCVIFSEFYLDGIRDPRLRLIINEIPFERPKAARLTDKTPFERPKAARLTDKAPFERPMAARLR
ncbi:hypothetical protein DdX_16068 [Ditylenchus destructor]|uniref:Uncharacterized protein n=1 Tax=Ditylenchus destructor TaxID=166010 RepID=A0AAD4R070_9BILA|nr:hypothetical protein DdX_16068 [Ditylenchus destructor]